MITIYSKSDCQKCEVAKVVLKQRGFEFKVLMLDVDYTKDELLAIAPGTRQLPVLVKDGQVVQLKDCV